MPMRKQLKYPPFCDIIVVGIKGTDERQVVSNAKKIHEYLKKRVLEEKIGILLYSPVPAPIDRIKNNYRWRIIIKCIYNNQINGLIEDGIKECRKNIKGDIRIIAEVNPNNMM